MNSLQDRIWEVILQNVFTCEQYTEKGIHFVAKIVVNIFYNKKRKFSSDEV